MIIEGKFTLEKTVFWALVFHQENDITVQDELLSFRYYQPMMAMESWARNKRDKFCEESEYQTLSERAGMQYPTFWKSVCNVTKTMSTCQMPCQEIAIKIATERIKQRLQKVR